MEVNTEAAATGSSIETTPTSTSSALVSSDKPPFAQVQSTQVSAQVQPTDAASSQLPLADTESKKKNKSIAWDHFTNLLNPDGLKMEKPRAKCNYCPQTYFVHSKSNGTTSMKNHMLYQCKKCPLYIPAKKQRHLAFDSVENGETMKAFSYNEDVARIARAKMVISMGRQQAELGWFIALTILLHNDGLGFIINFKIQARPYKPGLAGFFSSQVALVYPERAHIL
ncbi:uncharacterized protein LOC133716185 [Rosa rugosa]|uniref:uncharacterized protein LOC133716185 n=1 Tax=Rosa rugosa TaxID=74645 RepID=UPI002B4162DC|nr:uncharacterized protein LOC133716185 [Rosa rugosa]